MDPGHRTTGLELIDALPLEQVEVFERMAARPAHEVVIDDDWLARTPEGALEPQLPIIDGHHHLWARGQGYLEEKYAQDADGGHRIIASVHVQCASMYRSEGREELRPVGETEYMDRVGERFEAAGSLKLCAGIVGFADLTMGAAVECVLTEHIKASPLRFRGIRYSANWDSDPALIPFVVQPRGQMLSSKLLREGFAKLKEFNLSFDAWVYHPQLHEVYDLAKAFPDTTILIDHLGGPLGIGHYARNGDAAFGQWQASIKSLAQLPNTAVKLSGLGMPISGFFPQGSQLPPTSAQLASVYEPYVETCIEAFGVDRCLFASNFPADKASMSFNVLWNAFKLLTKSFSASERLALFSGTCARLYRLVA